jgi:hypothetical protein
MAAKGEGGPGGPGQGTKVSDLEAWLAAQYRAAVALDAAEGGDRFRALVAAFPRPTETGDYVASGRVRMGLFAQLRLRYPLGPAGYACLAFVARIDRAAAHYAYAYWRRGAGWAGEPEYICVSPTFDSRDGEYRRRFIRYPTFAAACDQYAGELAPYEAAALALVGAGRLALDAAAYPAEAAEELVGRAIELRIPAAAFAVALALDLWEASHGLAMVHTSAGYMALLAAVAEAQPELAAAGGGPVLSAARHVFAHGSSDLITVQCGQKLVPAYVREAMQPLDYNLAGWRELAVMRLAGDLVLNYVAPGFALYNQWTYVEGADAGLFENPAMEERYVRGRAAGEAMRSVHEARRRLAEPDVPQNYYTGELAARLYESVEYAQSYLLMAPVALAHTMEDVGWALRSLSAYVRRAPAQYPAAVEAFATAGAAARHLFEYAYGAHCLHAKLGVAHTDLHGNNLTFYMWGSAVRVSRNGGVTVEPYYRDPAVAYLVGPRGEADTYLFPAAGDSGCIVDFSRCLLGPAFRPRLEAGRDAPYATHFYRDQTNRVMRALHRYAPRYVKEHEAALKAAVLANYEAVFPVLCAVDFIAIGRSVAAALAEARKPDPGELRPFHVADEALELAARMEREAQEVFVTGLHDLAEAAGSRRLMPPPPFPGPALFERLFGEWRFLQWARRDPGRLRHIELVDAYNANNELRYAGADYARWPPWARLDEIERHLGEYRLSDLFERGVEPFLEALRPGARVEVIAERLRAEQEKLDGRPVATASSWLED